jgi:hypothetical protein
MAFAAAGSLSHFSKSVICPHYGNRYCINIKSAAPLLPLLLRLGDPLH